MSAGMFARGARDAPGTAGPRDSGSSGWGPRMSEPVRGELPRDAVGALLAQGWAFMERHGYLVLLVGLTLLWLWPRISEYLSTRAKVQKLQAAKGASPHAVAACALSASCASWRALSLCAVPRVFFLRTGLPKAVWWRRTGALRGRRPSCGALAREACVSCLGRAELVPLHGIRVRVAIPDAGIRVPTLAELTRHDTLSHHLSPRNQPATPLRIPQPLSVSARSTRTASAYARRSCGGSRRSRRNSRRRTPTFSRRDLSTRRPRRSPATRTLVSCFACWSSSRRTRRVTTRGGLFMCRGTPDSCRLSH